jgi:class 3 adenylate cyclase/tetratricopeptide (TPR) repeat protein
MSEERKLVTVLFADIVGSTALGQEHDAEVVRASLARAFDGLRGTLVAHGGTVEKFIGDAVMAVFGVPAVHDDDADRAVRAAFALRKRIAELNEDARIKFALRIGVNTGEVVAGLGEAAQFLVTGAPVNTASRLQSAAAPGEILVGTTTRRLTSASVRYGDPRDIEAKGIGAIDAWPALDLVHAVPHQRRGLGRLWAPLIGRDRELRLLDDALARVRDAGAPALVTILGAAGAGKSRLTAEFLRHLGPERALIGRCLPYGEGITFHAIQEMLRSDLGIEPTDDRAWAASRLESAVHESFSDPEEARAVALRVAAFAGMADARETLPYVAEGQLAQEMRWGVRRYFEERASARPLVLVFEDIHWAEAPLRDLIEHLAEQSRVSLLLICLARPELGDAFPAPGFSGSTRTIALAPLDLDQTRRLVAKLLVNDMLPESMRDELVRRSDGNPLYVEEFVRLLLETGRIEKRGERWVAVGDIRPIEVPPTLVGLITARLDGVPQELRRALQRASIAGPIFGTADMTAIAGGPVDESVLRECVGRDLLTETRWRAADEGMGYRFKHALIRDVAYSTASKSERARMHDNYSRWLERTLGDRADESSESIAFHAERAFVLSEQSRVVSREVARVDLDVLGARALDRLLTAATRIRHQAGLVPALRLYQSAASVADAFAADPLQRAVAHAFAAGIASILEATPQTTAALDRAHDLAATLGPSEALVFVLDSKARRAAQMGAYTEGARLIRGAVDAARGTGDVELLGETLLDASFVMYLVGEYGAYRRGLVEAREFFATSGARRGLPRCLVRLGDVARNAGDFTLARQYRDEALSFPHERTPILEANVGWSQSGDAYEIGDLEAGVRLGERSLDALIALGARGQTGLAAYTLADSLIELGNAQRAKEVLHDAIAFYEARQARGPLPEVHGRYARACVRLGDLSAAREHVAAARRYMLPDDAESVQITSLAAAELAFAEGDAPEADRLYRETIAVLQGSAFANKLASTRLSYGRFLVARGRCADARPQLESARAFYRDPLAFRRRDEIDALLAKCRTEA